MNSRVFKQIHAQFASTVIISCIVCIHFLQGVIAAAMIPLVCLCECVSEKSPPLHISARILPTMQCSVSYVSIILVYWAILFTVSIGK